MKINRLCIENFRSILSVDLELDDTTVFIGSNNAGKSAILETVRIALSRRWGKRGTGFTENDVHRAKEDTDPRTAPPVKIQMIFEEPTAGGWPQDMISDLDDVMSLTSDGRNKIALSITYTWDDTKKVFNPAWEFLNSEGTPFPPRRRAMNLSHVFDYLLFFWLGALRSADDEFTSQSRNWGGLLRSIKIAPDLEKEIKGTLDELDSKLLTADAKFSEIAKTIGMSTEIAAGETPGSARLRMLPLDMWDLLTRAGVVLRNEDLHPWLPIERQGHGLQNLAVIFLLQVAALQRLSDDVPEGGEPIFAIEEPEVHLHPQAARTLWERVSALPGQKLVTTHSPYFVQNVPLHNLRIVRLNDGKTKVTGLKKRIVSDLPWTDEVGRVAAAKPQLGLSKDPITGYVVSARWFDETAAKDLIKCLRNDENGSAIEDRVKALRRSSRVLISKKDEIELSFCGRRIRGEIFFAGRWILVEGPSDYLLLRAVGHALKYDLDQHGVGIIDFQNNGNPGVYAALGEAFEIPWFLITDGDAESEKIKNQILKRGFQEEDLTGRYFPLSSPNTLEDQLLADGHEKLLRDTLAEIGISSALTCSIEELKNHLKSEKTAYMSNLAPKVAENANLASKMPKQFVDVVEKLRTRKR